MKFIYSFIISCIIVAFLSPMKANAAQVTLSDIPAYEWYHGCGPTAAASIIGYYDLKGYDNLFAASGWDDIRWTSKVQDEISSVAHNTTYEGNNTNPDPGPADTSIADFFRTSELDLQDGWSYLDYADDAFTGYAAYKGYGDWTASNLSIGEDFGWDDLTYEIDNGRPLMFLVDTDGNNSTDHFIPVFGYDENNQFAFYDTWSEDETDIQWKPFQEMGESTSWGVGYVTLITPGAPDPVPIPSSLLLLGFGLAGLTGFVRKRR